MTPWPLRCPVDSNELRQVPPAGVWPGLYHCGHGHTFRTPFTLTLYPDTPTPAPKPIQRHRRPRAGTRPMRGIVPWWAK